MWTGRSATSRSGAARDDEWELSGDDDQGDDMTEMGPSTARTAAAQVLVGKTIASAHVESHLASCDAENVLVLVMTDGSVYEIEGGYGGYSGRSCDEYKELIDVR
jgi:hypothetical protein